MEDTANGFNATTDINNASNLSKNTTPLLACECRTLLLDIEGCTTVISFVHDVLFPFARNNVAKCLEGLMEESDKTDIVDLLVEDMKKLEEDHPSHEELTN
eukprot:15333943-Ditylum_brightwellii.AAC.1